MIVGASGGLGRELSYQLAVKGYRLFIHGRDREKLSSLSNRIGDSTELVSIEQNLLTREDIYALVEKIRPHIDNIDIAIVNFGPLVESSLADMASAQYEYLFDMNLLLPSLIITELAPKMAARRWGRIIVFGGTGTDQNRPYRRIAAYSAAKYALNSITRSAALEFGGRGVTINLIAPGYIKTEYYDTKTLNDIEKRTIILELEEVFHIVEYLVSDRSLVVNGAVINAGIVTEW